MRRPIIALLLMLVALSMAIALLAAPQAPLAALSALQSPLTVETAASAGSATRPTAARSTAAIRSGATQTSPAPLLSSATAAATLAPSTAAPSQSQGYVVRLHPDGELFVGDLVSFEVIAPPGMSPTEQNVQIELPAAREDEHPQASFGPHGIGARLQADLQWVWDTSRLEPGSYELGFAVAPDGPAWIETVTLNPAEQRPASEAGARWEQAASQCCQINYISGAAAARDIAVLGQIIDDEMQRAAERLGVHPDEPIEITLLPRVLGHGGFAGRDISVSYLDRDYMGGEKARILHHEIVHILDGRLGGELRPSMLVEGLAVYLSDGHFKAENLLPRAAALLPPQPGCTPWSETAPGASPGCGIDQFIPLERLIDNFYYEQHEVGYLESGALIAYMVETWGWPAFSSFYRDIHPVKDAPSAAPPPGQHSYAVEAALKKHFDLDLAALEQDFRRFLESEYVSPGEAEDLRLTLLHFDSARRYQAMLDPSAHFLTAWLLDTREMQSRQITADYLRRPSQPENLALETMLVASGQGLTSGDYNTTARLLAAANTVLDAYPQDGLLAFAADPLAADYLALVRLAVSRGYEPQQITIDNETARMAVSSSGPELIVLTLARQAGEWLLLSSSSASGRLWPYGVQVHRMPLSVSNGGWQYRFR